MSEGSRAAGKEEQRERILEAAAAAIATHGFHGMSMRELARATDRSLASFYHYFASKDEVLLALHLRAFDTLIATASHSLEGADDPVAQLYLFIVNHVGYFVQHGDVMRVLVQEASSLPAEDRQAIRARKERYFEIAHAIVERLIGGGGKGTAARKRADRAAVERATYCVFGMVNWVYGWYDPARHGGAKEVAHCIHQLALGGLLGTGDREDVRRTVDRRIEAGELPSPLRRHKDGEVAA